MSPAFFRSIRWHVQAWHGTILLLVIAAFCVLALRVAWSNRIRQVDAEIRVALRETMFAIVHEGEEPAGQSGPPKFDPARLAVVAEQLRRLARTDIPVTVEATPGETDGLGWRTRIELSADTAGRAGMHRFRSDEVVALQAMPLASTAIEALGIFGRRWPAGSRITVTAPVGEDRPVVLVDGAPWSAGGPDSRPNARSAVREHANVRGHRYTWRVAASGFWQVHREAPEVLAGAVLDALGDVAGATVLDLYSGAGLFTLPLADAVGDGGRVVAVEGDPGAVRDARRNAHDRPHVELHLGGVPEVLRGDPVARADVVVLDPPRVGAGREVVDRVAGLRPGRVVYVACDPAALARDVAYLAERGYALDTLRAFDLFPMTHHVECVATFAPA